MTLLSAVISRIESDDNDAAMRFEPHIYVRASQDRGPYESALKAAQRANRCSRLTACMILATSWGRFQIMGFNIYGKCKFANSVLICADVLTSSNLLARFFDGSPFKSDENVKIWDNERIRKFAAFYNGKGNVDEYSSRMSQVISAS